jgi:cytochrome c-type biogenesis protein CcmF
VTLVEVHDERGPNYLTTMAEMRVDRNGRDRRHALPREALLSGGRMPTTEAAIDNGVLRDLYLVIGDPQEGGGFAVRTYVKPFANWIWAGAIIMSLGGVLSSPTAATASRPARGRRPPPAQGVPAE